jgi:hypothetical protein
MEAVNPQNLEPVHDSVRSRPRPRPRSRSRRSNSRGVPSVSKQLLSRPSHAIVRSLRCSGAGPSGSWRGWPIRIQDRLLRPPPRELDRGLLSLSQRHVSQETSLGRSILLEQQPSLASAAWSKISSSLHVGDSSHSLLLPLQIAGFSLTLRIVLYMESFLVLGNY